MNTGLPGTGSGTPTPEVEPAGTPVPVEPAGTPKVDAPVEDELPSFGGEATYEDDFTDTKDGFAIADQGKHMAMVIDFEKGESKAGNPQYVWQFRILDGKSRDIEVRYWTSLLPQARWKAVQALSAVGCAKAGSVARFKQSDVVGKKCYISIEHEMYDGNMNHKVTRVDPINPGPAL